MTVFSCSDLSKSYNDKLLFESLSFGMEQGDRVGLIGKNGAGKTTLLKILAGIETPDSGSVIFNNDIRFEYLSQSPDFPEEDTALDCAMSGRAELSALLDEHKNICKKLSDGGNPELSSKLDKISRAIDSQDGWNLENEAKKILSKLGIYDFYQRIGHLSGGLKKRVALARALLSNPELLIMDEPTNHLDADTTQWLQDRLMGFNNSILFVTHDRYFLDAVATRIVEIDKKRIFTFPGSYFKYLELKESLAEAQDATVEHLRARLRTELAWLEKGAKARRSKQKSRIDWITQLEEDAIKIKEKKIKIELGRTFIGSRVIDAQNISKTIGDKLLFDNFTYIAKPKDRIGIIGRNGSGKSTLLNILSGFDTSDTGTVKIGASIKIGYFRQEITGMKDSQSVISALRDVAEYIDVGVGRDRYLTAKDLLNKFLFPPSQHSALIGTLSGGEKRRLALLRTLMDNPNVLLLDEPTNDFDLPTLSAFEDYLDDFYGTLIIVSHDRSFLDRTVEFIFSFDGYGGIKEYPGNYTNYLEKKEAEQKIISLFKSENAALKPKRDKQNDGKKLSYQLQRELDTLEIEIPEFEKRKTELEDLVYSGKVADYRELESKSAELQKLIEKIDIATMRWMELSEM